MNEIKHIKTVLIDDEPDAVEVLTSLLSGHPQVEIMATAANADSGLEVIMKENPDLVFLDIRMPGKTGFDLVARLRDLNLATAIVFVTAYDEYAIRAFKVAAFDYLLKPVDPDALAETLKRYAASRVDTDFCQKVDHLLQHLHHDDRIRVNTRAGFLLIDPAEIAYVLADGNYSEVFFSLTHTELVTISLGSLLAMLPEGHFLRLSRSAFVNRAFIYRVDRKKRICELRKDGVVIQLEVTRDFIRELE